MLVEASSQTVVDGHTRQWFADDFFDLYVWFDSSSKVEHFQLCYGKPRDEHALTWSAAGVSHHRVDDGEENPAKNRTPILLAAGPVEWGELRRLFVAAASELDPSLSEFVAARLDPASLVPDVDAPPGR